MGLSNADLNDRNGLANWSFPVAITTISGLILLFGDGASMRLRFARNEILDGEIWRFVSGHFVHMGPTHFLLNAAALMLVWYLGKNAFRQRTWLFIVVACIFAINAGLWLLMPELGWYVGLSGLLHGMLAAAVVGLAPTHPREAVIIGLVVVVKILYEQWIGPLPGSEATTGGNVVVNAHLYGAIGGALAATMAISLRSRTSI